MLSMVWQGGPKRTFRDCWHRTYRAQLPFLLPNQQHQNT